MTSALSIQTKDSQHSAVTAQPAAENTPENSMNDDHAQSLSIQCKLSIGAPDDPLEYEADAMADRVMRMPSSNFIQRKCAHCEEEEKVQRKSLAASVTPFIQAKGSTSSVASETVSSQINSTKGTGNSLDSGTKDFMQDRFNTDFSSVKIHTGDYTVQMSKELNAQAFTVGNDIYFNSGQYNPQSDSGKHLLAHELTHTVQQSQSQQSIQRKPTLTKADYNDIAYRVHKAIDGIGTDEEGVYRALQRLERDGEAIKEVSDIYLKKFGVSLEDDIRDDFSDEELQYALELIGITPLVGDELIAAKPDSDSDYEYAAVKLYKAMDQWGTNEEAIYGVLLSMENVPERIAKLKAAYINKYPKGLHGGDLEFDIRDEMSGSELDYALLLLNVTPLGNTAILSWISGLVNKALKKETADSVMNTLDQLSSDRLKLIVNSMINAGYLDKFKDKIMKLSASDFGPLVSRITAAEAEFADPGKNSTAATNAQKNQIAGILNQGMNVDPVTQTILAFVDDVGGRKYQADVEETLEKEITALTPRANQRAAFPKFGWPRYQEIADEAKKRTDAVFGHYKTGDALTADAVPGRNLFDFSEQVFSDAQLMNFANYLVTGHNPIDPVYPGKTIHQVHNADLDRADEKNKLKDGLNHWISIGTNKARLEHVNKNWSGAQSGGQIFLQRWDIGDVKKNRMQFWKNFQTMIHEYLHKITNSDYSQKARALGRTKEQVYTEGGTSYFDERVWKTLYPEEVRADATLREKVEGAVYPYDSGLIPKDSTYQQIDQFKQIVGVVGEENAAAAYFLGKTDRIGL